MSWAITYTSFLFIQGRDLGFFDQIIKKEQTEDISRQQEFLETPNVFKAKGIYIITADFKR